MKIGDGGEVVDDGFHCGGLICKINKFMRIEEWAMGSGQWAMGSGQ